MPQNFNKAARVRFLQTVVILLSAIVGENQFTELTDYVVPYGVLSASGVADVQALQDIASDYGPRTAAWVALKMEYPGY